MLCWIENTRAYPNYKSTSIGYVKLKITPVRFAWITWWRRKTNWPLFFPINQLLTSSMWCRKNKLPSWDSIEWGEVSCALSLSPSSPVLLYIGLSNLGTILSTQMPMPTIIWTVGSIPPSSLFLGFQTSIFLELLFLPNGHPETCREWCFLRPDPKSYCRLRPTQET